MHHKKRHRSIGYIWQHTRKRRLLGALLILFIIANVIIAGAYRNQTYPNTRIEGQLVGSVKHSDLEDRLKQLKLMPSKINLVYEGEKTEMAVAEIGASIDYRQISQYLQDQRPWLPVANLFTSPTAPLFVTIKPDVYQKKVSTFSDRYKTAAVDASVTLRDGQFIITPEVDATTFDTSGTQANIVEALQKSRPKGPEDAVEAKIMTKKVAPAITKASLTQTINPLQAQRNTAITVSYGAKSKQFSPNEIGNWFVRNGPSYNLSDNKISAAIADAGLELGAVVTNATEIATIAKRSVENKSATKLTLAGSPIGQKTFSFCTAGRNVPAGEVDGLARKAIETLNAKRGWSLGGNITFNHVPQTDPAVAPSCDFTLWLAAADQMPSFGAICDSMWSCAVRPNVVINYDRWQNASEAWNKDGGSIEDYRVMVINHEVGHWLGFDHSSCPASGQAAPVMQQQSINLQGCTFNPWPSAVERTSLRDYLNL